MSLWSARISRGSLLCGGLVALAAGLAAAIWLRTPTVDEVLSDMWTARAAVYRDLKEERPADALKNVQEWRGLAQKMPRVLWLELDEPVPGSLETLTLLDQSLAQLEGAVLARRSDLWPALAGRCFEAHRQCAALFNRTPEVTAEAAAPDPGHQHGRQELGPDEPAPSVALEVHPDPSSGWNLRIVTENFRFSPLNASTRHVPGEGHAHLFIDGKKITRLYGEWYYLGKLGPGRHTLEVSLNTNNHNDLILDGKPIAAQAEIVVNDGTEFVYFQTSTELSGLPPLPDEELCQNQKAQAGAVAAPRN